MILSETNLKCLSRNYVNLMISHNLNVMSSVLYTKININRLEYNRVIIIKMGVDYGLYCYTPSDEVMRTLLFN